MDGTHPLPPAGTETPAADTGEPAAAPLTAAGIKAWAHELLDWTVKLLPVIATVLVAVFANQYQAALTASTLLSERERADSHLRTEMFSRLVDPISGAKSDNGVSREREQLLAELLLVNFHEHIGLKPLLSHVDMRLARESADSNDTTAYAAHTARQSFRSVARTVISRQTAMLTRGSGGISDGSATIHKLDVGAPAADAALLDKLQRDRVQIGELEQPIVVEHPARTHRLYLTVRKPDWDRETFQVDVSIYSISADGKDRQELAQREFELSWFDFPLTDNTLLADGTRFAIVLDQVYDTHQRFASAAPQAAAEAATDSATRRASISVVWFPRDYIAAHERPTNHREFRRSLGFTDAGQ